MVGESWDLLTLDGAPVAPPAEYYMEVTEDDNGVVKGQFWKKSGGTPPVKYEGAIVLHGGPLRYTWELGELSGWMQWNPFSNSYVYYTSARGGLTRQLRQRDED